MAWSLRPRLFDLCLGALAFTLPQTFRTMYMARFMATDNNQCSIQLSRHRIIGGIRCGHKQLHFPSMNGVPWALRISYTGSGGMTMIGNCQCLSDFDIDSPLKSLPEPGRRLATPFPIGPHQARVVILTEGITITICRPLNLGRASIGANSTIRTLISSFRRHCISLILQISHPQARNIPEMLRSLSPRKTWSRDIWDRSVYGIRNCK